MAIMDPGEKVPEDKMIDSKKRRLSSILGSNWSLSPESKQQLQSVPLITEKKSAWTTNYTIKTPEKVHHATRYSKGDAQRFRKLKEYCRNVVPDSFLHTCYQAGYDTIAAITAMNVNMNDSQCDFNLIENYTKHPLPPGHKIAFAQFVKELQQKNTATKVETNESASLKRKYNELSNKVG
jgi:hypothetical protein